MRINIYGEELTRRVEVKRTTIKPECNCLVEKSDASWHEPNCATLQQEPFDLFGVRLYLGFPFMHRDGDDDTAAVTMWVPKLNDGTRDVALLEDALKDMLEECKHIRVLAELEGGVNERTED